MMRADQVADSSTYVWMLITKCIKTIRPDLIMKLALYLQLPQRRALVALLGLYRGIAYQWLVYLHVATFDEFHQHY